MQPIKNIKIDLHKYIFSNEPEVSQNLWGDWCTLLPAQEIKKPALELLHKEAAY